MRRSRPPRPVASRRVRPIPPSLVASMSPPPEASTVSGASPGLFELPHAVSENAARAMEIAKARDRAQEKFGGRRAPWAAGLSTGLRDGSTMYIPFRWSDGMQARHAIRFEAGDRRPTPTHRTPRHGQSELGRPAFQSPRHEVWRRWRGDPHMLLGTEEIRLHSLSPRSRTTIFAWMRESSYKGRRCRARRGGFRRRSTTSRTTGSGEEAVVRVCLRSA